MFSTKLCILCACVALSGGCYRDHGPASAVEITSAPIGIESSPSVIFGGRPVYLYQGHWYYREGTVWLYYVHEPSWLRHERHRIYGYGHHYWW